MAQPEQPTSMMPTINPDTKPTTGIESGQETPQHPLANAFTTNPENGIGSIVGDVEQFVQEHPIETLAVLGIIVAFILYYHTPAKEKVQSIVDNIHQLQPGQNTLQV